MKHIHFIGIGGISMSGIAHIMLNNGYKVSGTDRAQSPITDRLASAGAKIFIGHNAKNVEGADIIVYTAAISPDNEEYIAAKNSGAKFIERAPFLGELLSLYKTPIAVCGTHGKTTTTSMLACVLLAAGKNPTVLVGGNLPQIGGNFYVGGDEYLLFEACEYVDSFLSFYPKAAIVLNIEPDHLDYFSSLEQIKESFSRFASQVSGVVAANAKDDGAASLTARHIIFYDTPNGFNAQNIRYDELAQATFDVYFGGKYLRTVSLGVGGAHNVSNAIAVFTLCDSLGISHDDIAAGLADFRGSQRRFQYIGKKDGVTYYDDYAHHPTEIRASLAAARLIEGRKLWCVFQPHTYTRTKSFFNDFAQALSAADEVILADIYAAREPDRGEISSKMLADAIEGALYIKSFGEIAAHITKNVSPGDIVFTMGAGDINKVLDFIL